MPSQWPAFLQECRRVTRPGGIIRLTEWEIGFTNKPVMRRLLGLFTQALKLAGRTFSPDGTSVGLINMLAPLPSGALNADFLRMNPQAQNFVKQIDSSGRPIAVICHAPWLLVSAGLVKGRTLTSYQTIQDDLCNAGANWVDQEMVRDRNWVSSRSPQDLGAFNPAIVSLFSEYKQQKSQRQDTISA